MKKSESIIQSQKKMARFRKENFGSESYRHLRGWWLLILEERRRLKL